MSGRRSRLSSLPVRLDRTARAPLPAQLAHGIRDLISAGTLSTGDRLPSTRALAADLGVSRAVTEQAYEQLLAEGWVVGRRGSGTYVAATGLPPGTGWQLAGRRVASRDTGGSRAGLVRLDSGTPWAPEREDPAWRRAWREMATARPPRGYPDARGLPELRETLCDRLARTRGLRCVPEEVVLTHGTTDGLRHCLDALPPGAVAVEDPGYRAAVLAALDAGRDVHDVPVLPEGLDVGELARLPDRLAAVYVTPAHQHPLGVTMAAATRVGLLDVVRAAGALVVEDDYDSEFRYDVAPLPALAALDRDRVVYLGTASKAVAPGLRLGWLVGPRPLVEKITRHREGTHDVASWPVQRAYLALLRDGFVDRRVRAARRVYAGRGERVRRRLAGFGSLAGAPAGMYVTLRLGAEDEHRSVAAARAAGYDVPRLSDYARSAAGPAARHGLVLGFGGCTDAQLDEVLDVLATALGGADPA